MGVTGFDLNRQLKKCMPRLSGGLVKHLAIKLTANEQLALAA